MSSRPCNVAGVREGLRAIGGKWKCELLWRLRDRPHRYGELRRAVGAVTDRVLSRQLRELVAEGLVSRTSTGLTASRVEYALTEYGTSLDPILVAISRWGEAHARRATADDAVSRRSASRSSW